MILLAADMCGSSRTWGEIEGLAGRCSTHGVARVVIVELHVGQGGRGSVVLQGLVACFNFVKSEVQC